MARSNAINKTSNTTLYLQIYNNIYHQVFISVFEPQTYNGPCTYFHTLGFLFQFRRRGGKFKRQKWRFIYTKRKSGVFAHAHLRIYAKVYIHITHTQPQPQSDTNHYVHNIYQYRTFHSFQYEFRLTYFVYTYINPSSYPALETIFMSMYYTTQSRHLLKKGSNCKNIRD